ncbi:class I SAM-dependent methyltransferase [Mongoliitalea daihaiensis]|uniref:class I SAM-dependent methyltransferase n=1 Tax=Mongoliitalea daihaiensis TaxID=2782006 RepID=UPI001F217BDB|nr:class I SAM-dependent methyltransferase [Mongoliitalea daihaiensis]UJP65996.1 class I SAM-dependent methyltransferase [Mongoliitalea daihaiensis]
MRQQQCPNCATTTNSGTHVALIQCSTCGIQWTYLKEDIQAEALYEDEVYAVVDNRKSIFERIIFSEATKVIHTAQSLLTASNDLSVLDFGCGKGQFLMQAKSLGWKTLGVETATARAEFAQQKYGLDVLNRYYEGGKLASQGFDVISLLHVLEHLPQPMQLLQSLVDNNLKQGGVLVIEVPNAHSLQAKIAGKDWMHWDIPKHLSHWNEKSLEASLQKIGFYKKKVQYYSVHLGVLGMLRALMGKFGYQGNIIVDLKGKKHWKTLILLGLLLPASWLLELFAVGTKQGGVLRVYFQRGYE